MNATCSQEPKLLESIRIRKLLRMLQSMWQKYPMGRCRKRPGEFGVFMDENTYLRASWSGDLTPTDLRDLFVLFATWVAVDPQRFADADTRLDGSSRTDTPG